MVETETVTMSGGLVGRNSGGAIRASYATGDPNDRNGDTDNVGGLAGANNSTIVASYATGDPSGGGGNLNDIGGLVGENSGTIVASHASGNPNGEKRR